MLFAQSSPQLIASPPTLALAVTGGSPVPVLTLNISSSDTPITFLVSVSTTSGGDWLYVGPVLGGVTPATLAVSMNPSPIVGPIATSLAPGVYMGTIALTAAGAANSPLKVPVALTVTAPANTPALNVSAPSFVFNMRSGDPPPTVQVLNIMSSGASLIFRVSVNTDSGGNWLFVGPVLGGVTPASLAVGINPSPVVGASSTNLVPGTYAGSIVITADGASNSPVTVKVTLTVRPGVPAINGIVSAGSLLPGAVAPGTFITILGSALGPAAPASLSIAPSGLVSTALAGTRVWFDDVAAPLTYVSSTQVNAVVPYEVTGKSGTRLRVEAQGVMSPGVDVQVTDTMPAIFTMNSSGTGPGAILNQDYSLNSASNPSPRGSLVIIYATGEGQTDPPGVDGLITSGTLRKPELAVFVTIGGQPADVLYAGSAPGLITGVLQVNARVPVVVSGTVPIVLTIGKASSQLGVTIAVQ